MEHHVQVGYGFRVPHSTTYFVVEWGFSLCVPDLYHYKQKTRSSFA